LKNETHHDPFRDIPLLDIGWKGGEIRHHATALASPAQALHGKGLLLHRGRVIEPNLLAQADLAQRDEVPIIANAGIRVARMVDKNAGRLGVVVLVLRELNGHAFPGTPPFGFGKINHRAAESQNDFPGPNIPIGKDAQADITLINVESRVGIEVLYKLTFFGEQEKRRLVHKFRKSLDGLHYWC